MTSRTFKPSVLMVDDMPANLVALRAQLEDLDCELVSARSGNEALRLLLKGDYAVVLLDVQMPEMDGFEVARLARESITSRDIPIIFLTAMIETEESVLRGYGSGAVDVLFKPINGQILRSKVRVFLDLYMARRRLSDEVEAHKRTLADLQAFSYSVSHDLRAPLRPLDGFSRILLEDYADALDEKAKHYLVRIRTAATTMAQLIDDMLRLSTIGRADLRSSSMSLSGMVRGIVDELRRDDPSRVVELVTPDELTVQADEHLMRVALENLLRNAWKFTRGKNPATIELGVRLEGGEPAYFIADNGAGFDVTYAKRLFQPFQRFHRADEFEGTGIGLAIVERVIRRHGGRIWAESTPGSGAKFVFTLAGETP